MSDTTIIEIMSSVNPVALFIFFIVYIGVSGMITHRRFRQRSAEVKSLVRIADAAEAFMNLHSIIPGEKK